jgi:uncharacterized protein YndB with AHSA1/START domain
MSRIHQEVTFAVPPARVFDALLKSTEHARFTGAPAEISTEAGGAFSVYGGKVHGRNVEVVPGKRLVQAWRSADWAEGVYTVARFEVHADGKGTRLVFDQDGVPEGAGEMLEPGWPKMYWEPLRKYLEG